MENCEMLFAFYSLLTFIYQYFNNQSFYLFFTRLNNKT